MLKDDTILTIPEVAEMLRISKPAAYRLATIGDLPHIRIGKSVRVKASDLEKWLESKTIKAIQ